MRSGHTWRSRAVCAARFVVLVALAAACTTAVPDDSADANTQTPDEATSVAAAAAGAGAGARAGLDGVGRVAKAANTAPLPGSFAWPLPPPPTQPRPAKRLRVRRLADVSKAVIRVDVSGSSLYDPQTDQNFDRASGSGFLVHSNGTAVTNAHVVSGADRVTATINGSYTSIPARVLAVDTCTDIALLRLEGGGYPWLDWSDVDLGWGLKVSMFGHPRGQYAVDTRKGKVENRFPDSGLLSWLPEIVTLDLDAKPGSSGSAIVAHRDRRVVAIAMAVDRRNKVSIGIPADLAATAMERLTGGGHPADFGITAYPVPIDEIPVAGVRVISVLPGSQAARSRLRVGDVITHLDGERVGADRSAEPFCRTLNEHDHAGPLTVRVARASNGRVLEAAMGREKLQPIGKLDVIDQQLLPVMDNFDRVGYEYVAVDRSKQKLQVELPSIWSKVSNRTIKVEGRSLAATQATVHARQYRNGSQSGVTIVVGPRRHIALDNLWTGVVDEKVRKGCEQESNAAVRNDRYKGAVHVYWPCKTYRTMAVATLHPRKGGPSIGVVTTIRSPRDLDALDRIIDTVTVAR